MSFSRVIEYLLYIDGVPQCILLARTTKRYEQALNILVNHQGRTVTREQITLHPKSRVPLSTWEKYQVHQRGGKSVKNP